MQDRRNKKDSDARDIRQYIKIGKLVCKYFPSLLDCRSANEKESTSNLAFLEFVLKLQGDHPDILCQLRDMFDHQGL